MAEKPDSAYRKLPSLKENVGRNTARDVGTLDRFTSSGAKGAARGALNEATERAASRLVGRAGAAGAALSAGWDIGRAIDEKTGVGKKMVDKVMGPAKASGDRVELSSGAKAMMNDSDYSHESSHSKSESHATPAKGRDRPSYSGGPVREGKNENIDEDTRRRAGKFVGDL